MSHLTPLFILEHSILFLGVIAKIEKQLIKKLLVCYTNAHRLNLALCLDLDMLVPF